MDFKQATSIYKKILLSTMQLIVERYERNSDYPWIDTKFSVAKGQDFEVDDPIRGLSTVYSWIQGRALEALTEHVIWMKEQNNEDLSELCTKIERIMRDLLAQLRSTRKKNNGHMSFFMKPDGTPFCFDENQNKRPITLKSDSPYSYSDLFCSRGTYAAAEYLKNDVAAKEAKDYCFKVYDAILNETFFAEQQTLNSKLPSLPLHEMKSYSPCTLQLGTASLLATYEKSREVIDMGLTLIRNIVEHYVNIDGRFPEFEEYDCMEFLDRQNRPYVLNGAVICNCAHWGEFIGLSLQFLSRVKNSPLIKKSQQVEISKYKQLAPKILRHTFNIGYQKAGGVAQWSDLKTRKAVISNMPWWTLPECMRAAILCRQAADNEADRESSLKIFEQCHKDFVEHYVIPERNYQQIQTRGADGKPVDIIPATPDSDPGYHTDLCLLECLRVIDSF